MHGPATDTKKLMGKNAPSSTWSMAQCFVCGGKSTWRGATLIYPDISVAPLPHVDMPDEAKALYEEAAAVVGISRRAGAALARASLERLLKALDIEASKNDRLDDYIARVSEKVSTPLAELLTAIRHIGNKSLHVDDESDEIVALYLGDVEEGIVEMLFEAINNLVDELITRPKRTAELYARLPEGVRADAERKAAAARSK
jgi:K+-sensing histidine kinase KdpD